MSVHKSSPGDPISRRAALSVAAVPLVLAYAQSEANTSRSVALVDHDDFLAHDTGPGHPERAERLLAVRRHLAGDALGAALPRIDARLAERRWLETVHTVAHLDALEAAAASAPVRLDPDTVVSSGSYRAARRASGGVLAAIDAVMAREVDAAFVAARPPGHHARPGQAMGFCLVNHVAIGARYAQATHGIERVLIVDFDVHHGNGTQDAFYDDGNVLFASVHQSPLYPGTGAAHETGSGAGEGLTLNLPLGAGASDDDVMSALESRLPAAADAFRPQLVLVSAGFDGHVDDPLAGWALTPAGFARITGLLVDIADRHADGRIVSSMEGGYALDALGESVVAHVRALAAAGRASR